MSLEKVQKRIQKLLALAGSDNENEAASAAAQAHKLALKYNLSISQFQTEDQNGDDLIQTVFYESGRLASWKGQLAFGVAKLFSCSVYIKKGNRYSGLTLVGTEADVSLSRVTIEYLFEVVDRLTKANAYGQGSAVSNGYRYGLVARLLVRLREQAKANEAELENEGSEGVTALVLRKDQKVADFLSNMNLKKAKQSKARLDARAYDKGVKDADRVNLNRQMNSATKNRRFKFKRRSGDVSDIMR